MMNDWRKILKDKLELYFDEAPEGLWEDIGREIKAREARRRRLVWYTVTFASAAIVLALVLVVIPDRKPSQDRYADRLLTDNVNEPAAQIADDGISDAVNDVSTINYSNIVRDNVARTADLTAEGSALREPADGGPSGKTAIGTSDKDVIADDNDAEIGNDDFSKMANENSAPEPYGRFDERGFMDISPAAKRNRIRLSMSLAASGIGGTHSNQAGYTPMLTYSIQSALSSLVVCGNEGVSELLLRNNDLQVESHTRYYQPVRFGVNVQLECGGRFGVESGLNLSILSSVTDSGTSANSYEYSRNLFYLGIPLNVNYRLWSGGGLSVYASAGTLVQKCIYGKSQTSYLIDGSRTDSAETQISERQLQWSVNVSFGTQYRLGNKVSIFVEPGLAHYFDNGSHVDNVYKQRPLNFDFDLGCRFFF